MNELNKEIIDSEIEEEWFTLDSITKTESQETLYCISVDSPDKQFLAGHMGIPTHNTEEGKNEDQLKGEAAMIIGSIARLGRAAGVHLVIATQRPDATLISGETKANLGVRINCGNTDSNASSMILGNGEGARVKANPRGRLYMRIYSSGNHGQGLFAEPTWIDEYLTSKGLNQDGTPISGARSKLANVTDFTELAEATLDTREGVDNTGAIERIRQEEASLPQTQADLDALDNEDWGFEEEDGVTQPVNVTEAEPEVERDDRPTLTHGKGDENRFHRPEEDWDSDLESLIDENFD